MKPGFLCASAAALLLTALPATAAPDKDASYSYYVVSCSGYLQHRARGAADPGNAADAFYVAGWLSAYDRLEAPHGGIPEDTTLDDVMLWLEQYCNASPGGNLQAGLFRLGEEVRPRHAAAATTAPAKTAAAPPPAPTPVPQKHARHVVPKSTAVASASAPAPKPSQANTQTAHDVADDLKPLTF